MLLMVLAHVPLAKPKSPAFWIIGPGDAVAKPYDREGINGLS